MRQSALTPRILYVDSSRDGELLSTLRNVDNRSFCLSTVSTPHEALELIASEPFDLFILENHLPEMSGVELCRRIRQTDKKTPILFFSARTRYADGEVSIAAGATEYLVRPVGEDYLIETVRRLLNDYFAVKSKNQSSCCLAK